jgi:hypothetical protein
VEVVEHLLLQVELQSVHNIMVCQEVREVVVELMWQVLEDQEMILLSQQL